MNDDKRRAEVAEARVATLTAAWTHWRAEIARTGGWDQPYWSPDTDSDVDPLDDRDTRNAVRSLLSRMLKAEALAGSVEPPPPADEMSDSGIPTDIDGLVGSIPDLTGGLDSVAYQRKMRGTEEPVATHRPVALFDRTVCICGREPCDALPVPPQENPT